MRMIGWRHLLLVAIPVAVLAGFFWAGPIAQPPEYHLFADRRAWLGVPNVANVVSNAAFLLSGALGLCLRRRPDGALYAWLIFFGGVALVGAGSAYYHRAPANGPLVWDRLPMTLAFMGLYVAVLAEHVDRRLEKYLLTPAALIGPASVVYWGMTGDLRFYLALQVATFASLVAVVAMFEHAHRQKGFLLAAFALYMVAIICERLDHPIFSMSAGVVSGHTMKHLFAAGAAVCIVLMLWRRPPLARGA